RTALDTIRTTHSIIPDLESCCRTSRNPLSFTRFFFNDTATTEIYTLSLHDALPISVGVRARDEQALIEAGALGGMGRRAGRRGGDRKSTRLNSSHRTISYAVFCLKKKKNIYLRDVHLKTNSKPASRMKHTVGLSFYL